MACFACWRPIAEEGPGDKPPRTASPAAAAADTPHPLVAEPNARAAAADSEPAGERSGRELRHTAQTQAPAAWSPEPEPTGQAEIAAAGAEADEPAELQPTRKPLRLREATPEEAALAEAAERARELDMLEQLVLLEQQEQGRLAALEAARSKPPSAARQAAELALAHATLFVSTIALCCLEVAQAWGCALGEFLGLAGASEPSQPAHAAAGAGAGGTAGSTAGGTAGGDACSGQGLPTSTPGAAAAPATPAAAEEAPAAAVAAGNGGISAAALKCNSFALDARELEPSEEEPEPAEPASPGVGHDWPCAKPAPDAPASLRGDQGALQAAGDEAEEPLTPKRFSQSSDTHSFLCEVAAQFGRPSLDQTPAGKGAPTPPASRLLDAAQEQSKALAGQGTPPPAPVGKLLADSSRQSADLQQLLAATPAAGPQK